MAVVDLENFSAIAEDGEYLVRAHGVDIPLRYQAGVGNVLVVLFHGALDRSQRNIPYYQNFLTGIGPRHQISIADPTLSLDSRLGLGWYAGGRDLPVQKAICDFLARFARHIGAQRRVYLGGSGGGFAALYYSWADPGSFAVAVSPQINLDLYSKNLTRTYLDKAWPGTATIKDINPDVATDIAACYASRFENTVVYLQSTGDEHHFSRHLAEFSRVAYGQSDRFILDCGYWGVPRHAGSVPAKAYLPWVRAVIRAKPLRNRSNIDRGRGAQWLSGMVPAKAYLPWVNAIMRAKSLRKQNVIDAYHDIVSPQTLPAAHKQPAPPAHSASDHTIHGFAPEDVAMSRQLTKLATGH